LAFSIAFAVGSGRAHAGPAAACARAAERGQELRDEGKLIAASAELRGCLDPACPRVIAKECERWLEQVAARTPSVVIVVQDARGRDVLPTKVLVDGEPKPIAKGGRAVELDPGRHVIFVQSAEGAVEEPFVLREGERTRRVTLKLPPPARAEPEVAPRPSTRPVPALTWGLGGLAVVSTGLATFFGATAASTYDDLAQRCPACTQSEIDGVRSRMLTADIFAGVAVFAAAGALVAYVLRPARTEAASLTPTVLRW
jgi:hypothetical protein